jgi:flagellin FlaB
MLKKFMSQKGITGLETAIILIAFVVVAAVFAYTTLSAGLFSTQKSQEAVYSGLKEAQSTLELKGNVIATALGGEPIDFTEPDADAAHTGVSANGSSNKVVINYIDQYQTVNDLYWQVTKLGDADDDYLLETNEKFKITIGDTAAGAGAGNLVDALTTQPLGINTQFSLIVNTPVGAVLEVQRTTPPYIDTICNLR